MKNLSDVVIERVEAHSYSCRFDQVALRFGVGNMVKRDFVLVKIICSDGTIGYGEAHHAQSPTAIAELIRSSLAPLLIGHSPFHTEIIWDRIYRNQIATHGAGTAVVIAMSGLDIALWDVKGKILGMPVYRLLGGEKRKIRAYAGGLSLGYQPLETLEEEVSRYIEQGYTAIKLRVGQHPKLDAERVAHIRKTFGSDIDIAVDAATRYHILDIPEVVKYCEENRVLWLEEPFTPDNIEAYRELRKSCRVPIAAGENHYTKHQFRDLLVSGAIDILQADCTKAGGITEVKKIADMGAAWHLRLAPHTSQSMLSTAANVHVMCAIPNAFIYEADLAPINPFRNEVFLNPLRVINGFIEPNDLPGLGLNIDEEKLEKYAPGLPGPCYI